MRNRPFASARFAGRFLRGGWARTRVATSWELDPRVRKAPDAALLAVPPAAARIARERAGAHPRAGRAQVARPVPRLGRAARARGGDARFRRRRRIYGVGDARGRAFARGRRRQLVPAGVARHLSPRREGHDGADARQGRGADEIRGRFHQPGRSQQPRFRGLGAGGLRRLRHRLPAGKARRLQGARRARQGRRDPSRRAQGAADRGRRAFRRRRPEGAARAGARRQGGGGARIGGAPQRLFVRGGGRLL